jgi:hypothetical protein
MRTIAIGLICSMFVMSAAEAFAAQEATAWKEVAAAIPLGSKVKVLTTSGNRLTGTLMSVAGDAVMVKRNTRLPEPAVSVPFSEVSRLERDHGSRGVTVGKAIAIGLASGAGVLFGLFAMIAMSYDD